VTLYLVLGIAQRLSILEAQLGANSNTSKVEAVVIQIVSMHFFQALPLLEALVHSLVPGSCILFGALVSL